MLPKLWHVASFASQEQAIGTAQVACTWTKIVSQEFMKLDPSNLACRLFVVINCDLCSRNRQAQELREQTATQGPNCHAIFTH